MLFHPPVSPPLESMVFIQVLSGNSVANNLSSALKRVFSPSIVCVLFSLFVFRPLAWGSLSLKIYPRYALFTKHFQQHNSSENLHEKHKQIKVSGEYFQFKKKWQCLQLAPELKKCSIKITPLFSRNLIVTLKG